MTSFLERSEGFVALRHRGYRLYFAGMLARGIGVWMQFIAIPWLAVERGATPFELGIVSACLFLPALLISPIGGVVADRVNRLTVLLLAQVGAAIHGGLLLAFVLTGNVTIEVLALFGLLFGTLTAVELPVRQSFLTDLVPAEEVASAVSLHAMAWNTTRFLGPAIAGALIATVGVAACFAVAALSAVPVAGSVVLLRRFRRHQRSVPTADRSVLGALRDGVGFASRSPRIRWALVMLSSGGILGIQAFQTLAPLYVTETLGMGGGAFGAFMGIWGGGALVGTFAVTIFARGDRRRWLIGGGASLAALLAALAVTRWPPVAFGIAAALGFAQVSLIQNAMITVQQAATDEFRGRVMGLYTTVFQGTNPLGAMLAGILAGAVGVTGAMLTGAAGLGAMALVAAAGMSLLPIRVRPDVHPQP